MHQNAEEEEEVEERAVRENDMNTTFVCFCLLDIAY